MKPVLVIGGMNMDVLGMPDAAFHPGDSLPGKVRLRPGGVGRNIASALRRLGAEVELMTALGDDAFSRALESSCAKEGIGLRHMVRVAGTSCIYMAMHDHLGDMVAAVSDMQAMQSLSPDRVLALKPDAYAACVLDANLSREVLQAAAHLQAPLVADPVSQCKADRLLPILHRLTALKPNLAEARHLTGLDDPEQAAKALMAKGVKQVFVSMGSRGLYACAQGYAEHLSPAVASTHPATGAGDAMTAGIAYAVAAGLPPGEAARLGMDSAAAHLQRGFSEE